MPQVSVLSIARRDSPATAALTAIGIVYGDLGTSPLYTLQTVVQTMGGHFTPQSALGVLSLVFWTLIVRIVILSKSSPIEPGMSM